MIRHTKVTPNNLKHLYDNPNGNLYFRIPYIKKELYEVCEGFDYSELYWAVCAGECHLIWIPGPSLGTKVNINV